MFATREEHVFAARLLLFTGVVGTCLVILITAASIAIPWTVARPLAEGVRADAAGVAAGLPPCSGACSIGEYPVFNGSCYSCQVVGAMAAQMSFDELSARAATYDSLCAPYGTDPADLYTLEANGTCYDTVATNFSAPLAELAALEGAAIVLQNNVSALSVTVNNQVATANSFDVTTTEAVTATQIIDANFSSISASNDANAAQVTVIEQWPTTSITQRLEGSPLLVSGGGPAYQLKELIGGDGIVVNSFADTISIEGTGGGGNSSGLSLTNLGTNSIVNIGTGLSLFTKSLIFEPGLTGVLSDGIAISHTQVLASVGGGASFVAGTLTTRSVSGISTISVNTFGGAVQISDTGNTTAAMSLYSTGSGASLVNEPSGPAASTKEIVAGPGFDVTYLSDEVLVEAVPGGIFTQKIETTDDPGSSLATGVVGPNMTINGLEGGLGIDVFDNPPVTPSIPTISVHSGTCTLVDFAVIEGSKNIGSTVPYGIYQICYGGVITVTVNYFIRGNFPGGTSPFIELGLPIVPYIPSIGGARCVGYGRTDSDYNKFVMTGSTGPSISTVTIQVTHPVSSGAGSMYVSCKYRVH
jgi:hypothetical protein